MKYPAALERFCIKSSMKISPARPSHASEWKVPPRAKIYPRFSWRDSPLCPCLEWQGNISLCHWCKVLLGECFLLNHEMLPRNPCKDLSRFRMDSPQRAFQWFRKKTLLWLWCKVLPEEVSTAFLHKDLSQFRMKYSTASLRRRILIYGFFRGIFGSGRAAEFYI